MAAVYAMDIAWGGGSQSDQRFRRIAAGSLLATLLLSVVVTLLHVDKPDKPVYQPVPERIARLVIEARKPPPPPPPPPKVEEPEPAPQPEATPEPVQQARPEPAPEPKPQRQAARERAERAGVMVFKDMFADLRQTDTLDSLSRPARVRSGASEARTTDRSILTAGVAKGSGGVNSSGLSRDTGTTQLASRQATRVEAPEQVKKELQQDARKARARGTTRSDEEIELVFDRNKSAIYNIYNRALRSDPSLRGKVVFTLTIDPSGKVTGIDVVSSELGDDALERKLVLRIKRFDFGAREVAATTIRYTIDFFPS